MALMGDCSRLAAFTRVEKVSTSNAMGFASDRPEEWNYYLSKILYMQPVKNLAICIYIQEAKAGVIQIAPIDALETKKPQRMPGPGNKILAQGGHFEKLLSQI